MAQYIRIDDQPVVFCDPPIMLRMQSKAFKDDWCVYRHVIYEADGRSVLFYIGVSRVVDAFNFVDARANSEWVKYVTPEREIACEILATGSYNACTNYRARLVMQTAPHCNVRGGNIVTHMKIKCVETGEEFDTLVECAQHFGAAPSALSNHLRGKPYHKTVKGRTFMRIPRT